MRGELDEATLLEIAAKVPDFRGMFNIRQWSPKMTSAVLMFSGNADSPLPLAGLCLNDTLDAITEARCALHEAFAHLIWYRERSPSKPNELAAVFFGRFYATVVASCLYASGERLADAIIAMLAIDPWELSKSGGSRQVKVAQYLAAEKPGDLITSGVQSLGTSDVWKKSMDLRNRWVHEQPPLVAGGGMQFRRRQQWIHRLADNGEITQVITFGGGDEPEYSIDELIDVVGEALKRFMSLFETVIRLFEEELLQTRPGG